MKSELKIGVLLLLAAGSFQGFSQSASTLMGARSAGLGYSSSTFSDEWSLHNNIAGLSKMDRPAVAFAYDSKPALIGADRMAAVTSFPVGKGAYAFGLFRFGDALYSEQLITTGYANQFGLASLGLRLNYIQYRTETYGTRRALSISFGGIAQLTPNLWLGAYATNLNQPVLSPDSKERLPAQLTAGAAFKPSPKVMLVAEILKDLAFDPTVKGGIEYEVVKNINFRTGFNLQPNAAFFGFGFAAKKIKIDYALQYSHTPGSGHQASIIYKTNGNQKNHEK